MLHVYLYLFLLIAVGGMRSLSPYFSTEVFAQKIRGQLAPEDVVAVYASPDRFSDLPFHLDRRVMVVGSDRGTIGEEARDPEHAQEAAEWFPDTGTFVGRFNAREKKIYCLIDKEDLPELHRAGMKGESVVLEHSNRMLIANDVSS